MNNTQQGACYGILLSVLLAGIVVFDLLDTIVGWPIILLVGAVWGGLLIIPIYILGKKKDPREVDMDERDKRIIKRALLTSFVLLAGMMGVAFVVALFGLGVESTLSVTMDELSAVIYIALITFILVLSLAVLLQYGRGPRGEKS
jgi:membrane protease YdiL (CAAX protease family)